jgi:hypothetical protein
MESDLEALMTNFDGQTRERELLGACINHRRKL